MDPNVCWHQIAEAFATGDWENIDELAWDLSQWIAQGGFPPWITGHREFDKLVAKNALDALLAWDIE